MPDNKQRRIKVLTVFGTRPEAIKMAPLVRALNTDPAFESRLCVTAQHRDMLDQVLDLFNLTPDIDLDVMKPGQDLFYVTTTILSEMQAVIEAEQPDWVLVHGDTTTTMATALAAYYSRVKVGHVEAGLRTFNKDFPFPEEINRVVTDSIADAFFAPTQQARQNLLSLGSPEQQIVVTGNTVIDALHYTLKQADSHPIILLQPNRRLALVTVHRRENFGDPLKAILSALTHLLERFPDLELALPVHPNPNVKPVVEAALGQHSRVHLLPPQPYEPFCRLMQQADLVITDSGGVQEEAPSLGKPVLVLRDETERPEAVHAGTVQLVGANESTIVEVASRLLSDSAAYDAMARVENPYGDGQAVPRIVDFLKRYSS